MTPALLELPDLGRVPRTRTVYGDSVASARTALALLEAGVLHEGASASTPSASLVETALKRWIEKEIGAARDFHLRIEYEEEPVGTDAVDAEFRLVPLTSSIRPVRIGTRLADAERHIPRLGQTALVRLAEASAAGLPILLPQTLFEIAYALPARHRLPDATKRLEHEFPRWVRSPRDPLEGSDLDYLAKPSRTTLTGRLARAIQALDGALHINRDKVGLPHHDAEAPLGAWACATSWEKPDWHSVLRDLVDQWAHHLRAERIGRGTFAVARFRIDERYAENVRALFAGLAAAFAIARAAQGVIDSLATERMTHDD